MLEAAIETLDSDDYENLAIAHAHLAWTPPHCLTSRRVGALIKQAEVFASKTNSVNARAAVDEAQLYFRAGPDSTVRAEEFAQRIEEACVLHPEAATHSRRMLVARFRLVTAMQRGDHAGMARAIEARAALLPKLRNAEASWHHERLLLVMAMNQGAFQEVKPKLVALRERARRQELHASQLLCSLDYGVFLSRTSDVSSFAGRVRSALRPSEHDSPQVAAGKIRSMVDFGLHEEVRTAIANLPIAALKNLPSDRDYLATLCHLAVGAAAVGSKEHCEALLRLLSRYPSLYAVSASFHCEGSVASHLGILYEAIGRIEHARSHYQLGMQREHAFGLLPHAALTGFRLARLLLRDPENHREGLMRLALVRDEAERMGMEPLARSAHQLAHGAAQPECADKPPSPPGHTPSIQ